MNELMRRVTDALKHLSNGCSRVAYFLAMSGRSTTGTIRAECQVGNVSDMVIRMNPVLAKFGVKIINYAPVPCLVNSFGEKTTVHYWELSLLDGQS